MHFKQLVPQLRFKRWKSPSQLLWLVVLVAKSLCRHYSIYILYHVNIMSIYHSIQKYHLETWV